MFIGQQQESDSDESPNTYDSKQFCIIAHYRDDMILR